MIPPSLTYSLLSYSSIAPLHAFVYSALFYTRDEITYYCSILPFFYLDCTYWSLHCKYFRTTMSCNSLLANVVCFTCTTLNKALSYLILSYLTYSYTGNIIVFIFASPKNPLWSTIIPLFSLLRWFLYWINPDDNSCSYYAGTISFSQVIALYLMIEQQFQQWPLAKHLSSQLAK